jgi:exonuclease SbcC
MVPLKLELYNFLAYRSPPPLDLTGLHVACLVGANGAGKSSLLDAMTWALWGKARARRDDELIHAGEQEMQVGLTFLLEGNCYRVTRHRSRAGRGSSALVLEIQDGQQWRSLTENTIRATQGKLNRILRLNHDTFINSAFLMQGRADEFTKKTPGERKAILGEILGLDAWAAYEDRAKARLREIDRQRDQIDGELERIDDELTREVEYLRELNQAQQALAELAEQVGEAEGHVRELEATRREREALGGRYADLEGRIGLAEDERKRLQAEQEQYHKRLEEYREILAARDEIESGYAALQAARQEERELGVRLREHSDLRERQSALQQTIAAARSELEAEQRSLARQKSEHERTLAQSADEGPQLQESQAKIEILEEREAACREWNEQLTAWREERAELEGINRGLQAEMNALVMQRDQIEATVEPVCPLCGQELSATHRAELLANLEQQGNEKGEIWRANDERIEALAGEIAQLVKEVKAAEGELRGLPPLRQHVARLTERLSKAEEAQAGLENIDASLSELEATLSAEDFAPEARADLAGVEAELAALGYDAEAHEAAGLKVTEYEGYEARKAELDGILVSAPEAESHLARLGERVAALEEQVAEDSARLDELAGQIEMLDGQLADLAQAEKTLDDLRDREGQARIGVGAAQQKLNALEQLRGRREQLVEERDRLGEEQGIYEDLRRAFGKDGVPAMIIEAAIPDIEKEANQILARMTDGQMHLQFDTQREKVTGGTQETLDIRIADGLGTRDYATFSGGETFRVNFAVRLALSRLLARRAGAQLPTLIIDEGFGTQDAQGRERLVQAINAVQDGFDLILVVTHIDELKDAFPARIEVTKMPGGSIVELV